MPPPSAVPQELKKPMATRNAMILSGAGRLTKCLKEQIDDKLSEAMRRQFSEFLEQADLRVDAVAKCKRVMDKLAGGSAKENEKRCPIFMPGECGSSKSGTATWDQCKTDKSVVSSAFCRFYTGRHGVSEACISAHAEEYSRVREELAQLGN